jgi:hypothetical protein
VRTSVHSRARSHHDRSGDPLDGLVNLFDLGVVLAVGFLVAALASLNLSGLLSNNNVTIVQNPGSGHETIIVKKGSHTEILHPTARQASGQGQKVGSVYKLKDGRLIYVPGK